MEGKVNTVVYSKDLETIGEYIQILKKKPNDFMAHVSKGGGYYVKRIYDKAIDDYICALSALGLEYGTTDIEKINLQIEKYNQNYSLENKLTLSSISDLYNFIGLAFRGGNSYDRALFNYNNAIAIDPGHFRVYNNIGYLYLDLKKNELAIENFDIAIKYNDKYAEAYNNRGIAKSRIGHRKYAEEDYIKATKFNDKFPDPWYNLGILYFEDKRYKEAIKAFKKATKIANKFALAYFNLGISYSKVGKYIRSQYNITKAYKLEPDNPLILNALKGD